MGKNVADILLRMDTADFDHLTAEKKADFTQKFHDLHFLHTCTRIDCERYGAAARTDKERELYARALQKFVKGGTQSREDCVGNPHLPALNTAWLIVRTLFAVMCLTSTKDDEEWHAVDPDTVKAETVSVTVWSGRLGRLKCKQRMEYCLENNREPSARKVLLNFQALFLDYYAYFDSELTRRREEEGLEGRASGGQKGVSRLKTPAGVTEVLEVVRLCMRACCRHLLCLSLV
jgi:hypothetical protein